MLTSLYQITKRFITTTNIQHQLKITIENQCLNIKNVEHSMKTLKFPIVWLRDNCQCDQCFHQSSQSRQINWKHFNIHAKIQQISTTNDDNLIKIQWNDDHQSDFQLNWLKKRDFSPENHQNYYEQFYRPKPKHWNAQQFPNILQKFNYHDIMTKDQVLMNWLHELAVNGVALIKNAPLDRNVVKKLGNRVGYLKPTTYGETFTVESKPNAKNYAYLSSELALHTDLPYYEYKPGVNLLHCIEQSLMLGDGDNILADGFYIADILKLQYPQYYQTLTDTIIDWNDIGEDMGHSFHMIWKSPVICLDKNGNYTRINHSLPQRDSYFGVDDIKQVQLWYEAYDKFIQLLHEHKITLKTYPGDVLTFNNIRLVHGRTSYQNSKNNVRCIVGAYLDWDIIYSKLRILSNSNQNL